MRHLLTGTAGPAFPLMCSFWFCIIDHDPFWQFSSSSSIMQHHTTPQTAGSQHHTRGRGGVSFWDFGDSLSTTETYKNEVFSETRPAVSMRRYKPTSSYTAINDSVARSSRSNRWLTHVVSLAACTQVPNVIMACVWKRRPTDGCVQQRRPVDAACVQ